MSAATWTVDQAVLACPVRNDGHDATGTPGDCFRAALATLLGSDLHEVPHAVQYLSWWSVARRHVRRTRPGWDLGCWTDVTWPLYRPDPDAYIPPLALATGPSPRGPFSHVVVVDATTGALAHDPHPSRAGLLSVSEVYGLIGASDDYPLPPLPELTP